MKTISLWQPWASAIAVGAKRIETRGWYTGYRGPLAIHAAKRCVKAEMIEFGCSWLWRGALAFMGDRPLHQVLPFGTIVAICELVDCRPTESFSVEELDRERWQPGTIKSPHNFWTERDMGDFHPGRWGWILDHVTSLTYPLPYKGMQGFFDVPEHLLEGRFDA